MNFKLCNISLSYQVHMHWDRWIISMNENWWTSTPELKFPLRFNKKFKTSDIKRGQRKGLRECSCGLRSSEGKEEAGFTGNRRRRWGGRPRRRACGCPSRCRTGWRRTLQRWPPPWWPRWTPSVSSAVVWWQRSAGSTGASSSPPCTVSGTLCKASTRSDCWHTSRSESRVEKTKKN